MPAPSFDVLYIVAAPYSGSTLLTLLLAGHPAVSTLGERGHYHRKMIAKPVVGTPYCACGRRFAECERWQAIQSNLRDRVPTAWLRSPFSTFELAQRPRRWRAWVNGLCLRLALAGRLDRLPPPWRTRFRQMQDANAALITATLAVGRGSLFVDASKQVAHAVYLARTPGLTVRAVHLLRDGRGQLASTLRHHPERAADRASRQWAARVQKEAAVLAAAQIPHRTVRYEALCADPAGTLAALFTFCERDPTAWRGVADETPHIMGNPMRLRSLETIVADERWRAELSPAQLTTFDHVAGAFNRSLGAGP